MSSSRITTCDGNSHALHALKTQNLHFLSFLSFAGVTAMRALCCGLHHTYGNLDLQKTFSRVLTSSECQMYCRKADTSGTVLASRGW